MKIVRRSLLILIAILCVNMAFAGGCPPVSGYTVTHAKNSSNCIYRSSEVVGKPSPHGIPTRVCPRFVLTDPHYSVSTPCHADAKTQRCICVTTKNQLRR